MRRSPLIDGLQYARPSEKVFRQMQEGGLAAVHMTITYHEDFRGTVRNIEQWNRWFEQFPGLIIPGRTADDITLAQKTNRTAIFFGSQNPSCMDEDIGLIEVLHTLGMRFMQLTYNNQSLLATGCYEQEDPGLSRMGREVIREMNRVGLVVDMSHSAERSTLEAIEHSTRPIAITHANAKEWHPALRNKSADVLRELGASGGMLGVSTYPHHLRNGSACSLADFCGMIAHTAELMGAEHVGIGTDLCQDQPDSVVQWMRVGHWTKGMDYGEGSAKAPGFPAPVAWHHDNRDLAGFGAGLREVGFSNSEVDGILGGNWARFYAESFTHQVEAVAPELTLTTQVR